MKMDEVVGGAFKIGGVTYNMVEAKYAGVVVWPTSQPVVTTTYEVVASSVYYIFSNGGSYLLATGGNYAAAYGTVNVKENGTIVETKYNTRLDVYLRSDSPFYISNNQIFGYNLGTDPYPNGLSSIVKVSYLGSSPIDASTLITQEANEAGSPVTVQGTPEYDYANAYYEYEYHINFSANRYNTTASKCPANGGTATLSLSAYHYVESWIPWTRTDTVTVTYTSQAQIITHPVTEDVAYSRNRVTDNATITGSATGFSRNNLSVSVASYASQSSGWDTGRSVTYTAKVLRQDTNTYETASVTIYQDADSIDHTAESTTREWTSQPKTAYSEYDVYLTIANYTTASRPAPANENSVGFGAGGSHREVVTRNYADITATITYWVSGRQTSGTPTTVTGVATISDQTITTDVPTITFSYENGHGSGWLTKNTSTLTISSEGTTTYTNGGTYGRRGKVTATNGTATQELYVYQARNERTTVITYRLSLSIGGDATLPALGGSFPVHYSSFKDTYYHYTSGSNTETVTSEHTSLVSASSGCSTSVSQVTGGGTQSAYFTLTVPANTSTTQTVDRTVYIRSSSGATPVTDTKTQDAAPVVVENVATFTPVVLGFNQGSIVKGRVYYALSIDSGTVYSSQFTGIEVHYEKDGVPAPDPIILGSSYVEETVGTNLGILDNSYTFTASGSYRIWFEIHGSIGSFDRVNAGEDYSYTVSL